MISRLYQLLLGSYQVISRKILVKLIMFIVIPNILFLLIINQLIMNQIQQNAEDIDATLHMLGHATSREINTLFNDVTILTNHILVEPDVQRILSKSVVSEVAPWQFEYSLTETENTYDDQETMYAILSHYRLIWNNISSIAVISKEGDIYLNAFAGADYQITGSDLAESFLYKEVSSPEHTGLAWSVNDRLTQDTNMITIARKIYGMYDSTQIIGYVVVNLPLDAIKASFEVYNYYEGMIFGIINKTETSWMGYDHVEIIGGHAETLPFSVQNRPDELSSLEWNEEIWRTEVTRMENQDYLFVGLNEEFIKQQTTDFRNNLYLGYAFFFLLACFISLQGTKTISTRLGNLNRAIKSFGQKKWGTRIELKGNDEINDIASTFNSMAKQIEELLEDVKKQQKLKRKFELRVLEYQINPHFLYNTLDSINWLALESGQTQVTNMVNGLSKLFRLILSKGKEVITLEEEFEMIRIYLDIQKIRFEDRFNYSLDLEQDIAKYPISKLVLQPIVENAIVHGIRSLRRPGEISIKGRSEGDLVVLEVTDNGTGMALDKVARQLELLEADIFKEEVISQSGYGMKNVDSRLKLLFGNAYKMTIHSSIEEPTGTMIQIQIKKSAMEP